MSIYSERAAIEQKEQEELLALKERKQTELKELDRKYNIEELDYTIEFAKEMIAGIKEAKIKIMSVANEVYSFMGPSTDFKEDLDDLDLDIKKYEKIADDALQKKEEILNANTPAEEKNKEGDGSIGPELSLKEAVEGSLAQLQQMKEEAKARNDDASVEYYEKMIVKINEKWAKNKTEQV